MLEKQWFELGSRADFVVLILLGCFFLGGLLGYLLLKPLGGSDTLNKPH